METTHNISTAQNTLYIRARVRSVLTFLGIVTAIICSLILVQEIYSPERVETRASGSMEISKVVNADALANVTSTMWVLVNSID